MSGSGRRQADCLVVDLDGTLLNAECVITPRTAEALRAAVAAGVQVVIATVGCCRLKPALKVPCFSV